MYEKIFGQIHSYLKNRINIFQECLTWRTWRKEKFGNKKCMANQWFAAFSPLNRFKWYSSSSETHLRATKRHLPYGITRCYLPLDTDERAPS